MTRTADALRDHIACDLRFPAQARAADRLRADAHSEVQTGAGKPKTNRISCPELVMLLYVEVSMTRSLPAADLPAAQHWDFSKTETSALLD